MNKDKPILGLAIVKGLTQNGQEWSGHKILAQKMVNIINVILHSKIRGYIGASLLGRTEYWHQYES